MHCNRLHHAVIAFKTCFCSFFQSQWHLSSHIVKTYDIIADHKYSTNPYWDLSGQNRSNKVVKLLKILFCNIITLQTQYPSSFKQVGPTS